ncbi:MAG: hypothetical protein IJB79_02750 [Candidatus Gastranaerophilales bacterium]|nr:hypothetical protein [Candidatus Gastranaerophilales bacterium]
MKIPSIISTNSVKLLSGLANNDDSLAAMVIKDWIGDGATVYTYKKEGGKDDAREKAIEEFGTGAVWLFAIPAIKKFLEATVYPIFELNPKFDPRLLNDKNKLQELANLAKGKEKDLFDSLDKANPVVKNFTNAQMYKGFAVGKFLVATTAAAFALTKIIKFKQKTTTDRIEKENQNKKTKPLLNNKKASDNINFKSFMDSTKKKGKDISFTGGLAEFMYNPIKNTMILDGVIATTRLKEARKEEIPEVAFKEICQIVFIYGLAKPIQLAFEGIGKLIKCPIKLDPKTLFSENLADSIKNAKPSFEMIKNSDNVLNTLTNLDVKDSAISLLENEGLISLTKDKSAISLLKPIDEKAIKGAIDNFEDMGKNIQNLKGSKIFKTVAVISNILIAAGIMGVIQPKLTILLRKMLYGSNVNPAIAQQEKQAQSKNNQV